MITVKFSPDEHEIKITGHADTAEKGHDLVCSAVSILFYTLCESITKQEQFIDGAVHISMADGNGELSCKPTEAGKPTIDYTFWVILNGFLLLAESYPEAIKVE